MNWDALGAIGELVGALAVVLTLAYLAVQVRQNTVASRVAAKQEITRQYSDFIDLLLTDSDLFDIYQRGLAGELEAESDRGKFSLMMRKAAWYWSSMHYQYSMQSLTDDEWHQSLALIKRVRRSPGFWGFWKEYKAEFSAEFVQFIDEISESQPDG